MTMFQFYLGIPNLDGPYWTMIIETLFYLFMIVLFQFNLLKHLTLIGGLLTLLIIGMIYNLEENFWAAKTFFWIPLLQFWPLFFSGILFYKINKKDANTFKYYATIILCFISQIVLFNYFGRSKGYINFWEYVIMLLLYYCLFTLFVNGHLKFIVNKPLLFLGKISFALYLIHQKISIGIIHLINIKLNMNFWFASAIALLCSIILATSITYFIEVPYGKKLKSKLYSMGKEPLQLKST